MNKERLNRITRVLLAASFALTSCREVISPQQSPEPTSTVLPFGTSQTEFPEISTSTPEIEFIKDFENRMAPGEIIKEEELVSYNNNLIRGFCGMMDCRGFYPKVAFKYLPEEMKRVGQEEGFKPIAIYRTEATNELARRAPDRVLGPDQIITLAPPDNTPPFQASRIKGFALYGTFEEERGEILTNFNEMAILWASNEFARWNGLTTVVMVKDRKQFELTQETFFRLGISFFDIWPYYRESRVVEFASFVGKKMGGMTDEKKLSLGFGLLYALDKADKETIDILLPPLEA